MGGRICTCAMHCPESPYHERACCGQLFCDCWCHEMRRRQRIEEARCEIGGPIPSLSPERAFALLGAWDCAVHLWALRQAQGEVGYGCTWPPSTPHPVATLHSTHLAAPHEVAYGV